MKERARSFRKSMTAAEQRLWYFLRDRRLGGYKFVREYVIGPYIADFVCRNRKVIVEVDGGQHTEAIVYDQQRTDFLQNNGYTVLRVWNDEVFINMEGIATAILDLLENAPT